MIRHRTGFRKANLTFLGTSSPVLEFAGPHSSEEEVIRDRTSHFPMHDLSSLCILLLAQICTCANNRGLSLTENTEKSEFTGETHSFRP